MTTWGSDLNADIEIALFREGREGKVHAITMVFHGTWMGMRKNMDHGEEEKKANRLRRGSWQNYHDRMFVGSK